MYKINAMEFILCRLKGMKWWWQLVLILLWSLPLSIVKWDITSKTLTTINSF
jgi:hypothetical protein